MHSMISKKLRCLAPLLALAAFVLLHLLLNKGHLSNNETINALLAGLSIPVGGFVLGMTTKWCLEKGRMFDPDDWDI